MTHDQIMDALEKQLETIAQNSIYYTANNVPEATRKYSGQARASINLAIGSPDTSVVRAANYRAGAISGELELAARKFKATSQQVRVGDKAFVSSNLEYAPVIEYKYGDLPFNKSVGLWPRDVQRAVNDTK